jgi:hypothetical protein
MSRMSRKQLAQDLYSYIKSATNQPEAVQQNSGIFD